MAGAEPRSSERCAGCWGIQSRNRGNLPGATEEPAASESPLGHWYTGRSPWRKAERQQPGSAVVGSAVPVHPLDLSPPQPLAVLCFCQHSGHATAQNVFSPIVLRVPHSLRTATDSVLRSRSYQELAGFPSCQINFFRTCISLWLEQTYSLSVHCMHINYP